MKCYEVIAKCGHVGKGKCVLITFACVAENGKEAAAKVRAYARVKHHHKDAIQNVREILFEEYIKLRAENDADPYLHCKNRQEQNKIPGFEERIIPDPVEEKCTKSITAPPCESRTTRSGDDCGNADIFQRRGGGMSKVYINAIKFNRSLVDGPGVRTVVFFQGCDLHCPGCQNPSTWDITKGTEVSTEELATLLKKNRSTER